MNLGDTCGMDSSASRNSTRCSMNLTSGMVTFPEEIPFSLKENKEGVYQIAAIVCSHEAL
jgi:hypothetical protein